MGLSASDKHEKLKQERTFLTSLLEAALQGQFAQVERLVEDYSLRQSIPKEAVLLQFRDGQERTALHFACQSHASGSHEKDILEEWLLSDWLPASCVSQLIRRGDAEGLTPLMLAAQLSDQSLSERRIQILLQAAAKDEATSVTDFAMAQSKSGATALHYAASAGATTTSIRKLHEAAPAAISTFSKQGGTPLQWACAAHSQAESADTSIQETINALLDCGADWNACNETTFPPLAYALATNHSSRAKFLLQQAQKRSIDTTKTLKYELPGQTTMYHMAADLNMVGVLALLLELLPDASTLERRNSRGLTARELAAAENHVGCVMLLMPEGQQTEVDAQAFIQAQQLKSLSVSEQSHSNGAPPSTVSSVNSHVEPNEIETKAQQQALGLADVSVTDDSKQQAVKLKADGNVHFAKKEFQQALECYTKAIEADPTDATFYSNRSACYIHLQDPTKALQDAVICRFLKPNWPKAAYRMAIARLELGRYEDAAVAAWEGLQQDEENDELKSLLQKCVKLGRKQHQATR
ncbi:glycerophosphocholine phosphodiesterase [Mayamaea pseudoterrestris]|nr:glycerophosphocholine phosphodiesterase [Mayamaea pseudoterrestris]